MEWTFEHDMVVRRFGAGPRELVWLHGLGEQSASFDAIARRLTAFAHVLPDLPGYGRSPWPRRLPAGDSLAHAADHLAAWIGDRRPVVLGHSMGGVLAQLLAERVALSGVIVVDGNLTRGDCTLSAQAVAYGADEFAARGFDILRDEVYAAGASDPAHRGYYAALRLASPQVFHRNAIDLVAISETATLAGQLAALAVPACFIAGVPGGICERSRKLLDEHGIRWIGIAPSGHWPFIDQPEAFAEAVESFTTS